MKEYHHKRKLLNQIGNQKNFIASKTSSLNQITCFSNKQTLPHQQRKLLTNLKDHLLQKVWDLMINTTLHFISNQNSRQAEKKNQKRNKDQCQPQLNNQGYNLPIIQHFKWVKQDHHPREYMIDMYKEQMWEEVIMKQVWPKLIACKIYKWYWVKDKGKVGKQSMSLNNRETRNKIQSGLETISNWCAEN